MGQEIELKYRATPELLDAVQAAIPGAYTHFQMETAYYDTPDRALSGRRWTLRRRRENGMSVCTLKTPRPDGFRGEWDTRTETIEQAIPILAEQAQLPELLTLAAGGLIHTCGARFVRRAVPVALPSGAAELALDCGVLVAGTKELPFAELEIELKSGDTEDLIVLAKALAARFSLVPEPASKYARARRLAQEE